MLEREQSGIKLQYIYMFFVKCRVKISRGLLCFIMKEFFILEILNDKNLLVLYSGPFKMETEILMNSFKKL